MIARSRRERRAVLQSTAGGEKEGHGCYDLVEKARVPACDVAVREVVSGRYEVRFRKLMTYAGERVAGAEESEGTGRGHGEALPGGSAEAGFQQVSQPLPPDPHPPGGLRPPDRSASLELHQGLRSALLPTVQIHLNSSGMLSKNWGVPQSPQDFTQKGGLFRVLERVLFVLSFPIAE